MHVQMRDFLPAVCLTIYNQTVAILSNTLVARDFLRHRKQASECGFVIGLDVVQQQLQLVPPLLRLRLLLLQLRLQRPRPKKPPMVKPRS